MNLKIFEQYICSIGAVLLVSLYLHKHQLIQQSWQKVKKNIIVLEVFSSSVTSSLACGMLQTKYI